jgi:HPt (histidine-containing phosphotransfer) domain-containing protein
LGNLLGTQEREVLAGYYIDFLESSTPTIEQIQEAFQNSDLPQMSSLAHKLKSSARTVGANPLADCCQALETSGKDDDADAVVRQIEILPALFRGVQQWIEDHCITE